MKHGEDELDTFETKAFLGGAFLIGRQCIGMVLSLISVVVVTRVLGPHKYGFFVIVSGIAAYINEVAKLGLDVYLIRHQGDLEQSQIGVTQTLYLLIGLGISIAIIISSPFLAEWYKENDLRYIFQAYSVIIPITMLTAVPTALLERQLAYRKIVSAEFAGQLGYVVIALPLIWLYCSVWVLVVWALAQSMLMLVLTSYWSGMSFLPRWSRSEAKAQIKYGISYAASIWIWQGRDLVNPVLVGKLLGTEAVAFVAMAVRLTNIIGFAKGAVWRIYMSLLARVAFDRERMKKVIEAGLSHQLLILAVVFVSFTAVAPELVAVAMGERWLTVLRIFPFISAGMIVNSGFSLYSSALYVIGENKEVTLFHIIHVTLFAIAAWCVIATKKDVIGYGWAEIAALASYYFIRRSFHARLFAVKEKQLYFNILFALCLIFLFTFMSDLNIMLRLITLLFSLLIFLFVIPQNRVNTIYVVDKIVKRLRSDYL
jgi:PST family polysaccharide transporter